MPVFDTKYLSDPEIWSMLGQIAEERAQIENLLAERDVIADLDRAPALAKRLYELDQVCRLAGELKNCLKDIEELDGIIGAENNEGVEHELAPLHVEYTERSKSMAGQIYQLLLDKGYLEGEREDDTDLKIMKFIDYAGPEYAWRLSINIGIGLEDARRRLEKLLEKGLLERVEGNMLDNYHREKSWTKHMNHTYYRMSREGKLYLRRLRREMD